MKDDDKRIGNQLWKVAYPECLGRPRQFKTPKDLWNAVVSYLEWCDNNPIETIETTKGDKSFTKTIKHKVAYTWQGLYVFLGVCNLDRYKEQKDFLQVTTRIERKIFNQKLAGAAAGIFNGSFIALDLGLAGPKDCQVVLDRMIKLDPTLEVKINDKSDGVQQD